MLSKFSLKTKTILFVTVTLILFALLLLTTIYFDQKEKLKKSEDNYYFNVKTSYEKILEKHEHFYRYRLENLISTPGVKSAFYSRERKKLLQIVRPQFELLKSENEYLKILHFHLPNGDSFLRLHKPEKYGDNIASKRSMAAAMHKIKKPLNGFEAGIYMLAYREFLPIFYKDKYIGSVELGSRPDQVLAEMHNIAGTHGVLFVKNNKIIKYAEKSDLNIGKYRLQYNSLENKELVKHIPKDYDFNSKIHITSNGKVYAVYPFNMYDYEGSISAKVLYFNDITDIITDYTNTLKELAILLIALFGILILIINVSFSKFIKTIENVNDRLKSTVQELQNIKLFQDSILHNSAHAIIATDKKGVITLFNKKAENILGYRAGELVNKQTPVIFHKESEVIQRAKEFSTEFDNEIKPGFELIVHKTDMGLENSDEWTYVTKQGKEIVVSLNVTSLTDTKGNTTGYLVMAEDISKRKRLQKELDLRRKELEKEKEKFQSLTSLSSDGIFIMSTDDGKILEFSNMVTKLLGYSAKEIKELSVLDWDRGIKSIDDYHKIIDLVGSEPVNIERVHTRKDGSTYIAAITAVKIIIDEEEVLYASVRDITKEKKQQELLEANEKKLQKAQSVAHLGIWELDIVNNTLEWSDEIYEIFELDQEVFEPSYEAFVNIIHPQDRQKVSEAYNNSLVTREKYEITHRLIMEDGRIKWVEEQCDTEFDEDGKPLKSIGTVYDITDQKIKEEQVAEQKQELETIFHTTKDGIAITDLETNFLYFNDSYLKMTGFTKEELLTKSCAGLSAPEDVNRAQVVIADVLEKGHVENFEKTCIAKNAKRVKVNMSIALMPDKQRLLISAKDITLLKEKEKQIQEYVKLIDQNIITSSTDLEGDITYVSEAFCNISGYSRDELIGQNHRIIKHPDTPEELYKDIWDTLTANRIWNGEIKNKKKDGGYYWVKASISPTFNDLGEKIGYTAIRQDITDKKIIEEISITDGLTGIYNRRHFNDIFPKVINSAKRNNELISFIIMDIDHFKQYNDTYGHQMGDDVLVKVAGAIKDSMQRADDYCFRLGGEEFGVIFKADTKDKAKEFANSIKENIENLKIEHSKNSASSFVTASMGLICKNANDINDADEVYKQGDDLLYKAKNSGRNRVVNNFES